MRLPARRQSIKICEGAPTGSLVAVLPCHHLAVYSYSQPSRPSDPSPPRSTQLPLAHLDPGRQALLVLAHLRPLHVSGRHVRGGQTTAWRCVRESIDLLVGTGNDLQAAVVRVAHLAYAILDRTLTRSTVSMARSPNYSGKYKRHGVNVQVFADAAGRLVWASPSPRAPES